MRYCILYISLFSFLSNFCKGQNINFLDANFKNYLINIPCVDSNNDGNPDSDADTNNDKEIQITEAESIHILNLQANILDYEGLQFFKNLDSLTLGYSKAKNISLPPLTNLIKLAIRNCEYEAIDLTQNNNIEKLFISDTYISEIDLFSLRKLVELELEYNKLINLDLTRNLFLKKFQCRSNLLESIKLESSTQLTSINCSNNNLSVLNIKNCTEIQSVIARGNLLNRYIGPIQSKIQNLDLTQNKFDSLTIENNPELTKLDILQNANLSQLIVTKNYKLNAFDIRIDNDFFGYSLTNLKYLDCSNNVLTKLNIDGLIKLVYLNCSNNKLAYLNVSQNYQSKINIIAKNNLISSLSLNLFNIQSLDVENNLISSISCNNWELESYNFFQNPLQELTINSANIAYATINDLESLRSLVIVNSQNPSKGFKSLHFTNLNSLENLECSKFPIQKLEIQDLPKLTKVNVVADTLIFINLPSVTALTLQNYVNASYFKISNLENLSKLIIDNTNLTKLELTNLNLLGDAFIQSSNIKEVNFSNFPNLFRLRFHYFECENLLLSNLPKIIDADDLFKDRVIIQNVILERLQGIKKIVHDNGMQFSSLKISHLDSLVEYTIQNADLNILHSLVLEHLSQLNNCYIFQRLKLTNLKLNNLPELQRFFFSGDINWVEDQIIDLMNLPKLRYVTLSNSKFKVFNLIDLPNLERLELFRIKVPDKVNLQNLDNLVSVNIKGYSFPKGIEFKHLIALDSISIAYDDNTTKLNSTFTDLPNLKYLNLDKVTFDGIQKIEDLLSLQNLIININFSYNKFNYLTIKNLTSLKNLNISYLDFCNIDSFYEFNIPNLPHLETLNIKIWPTLQSSTAKFLNLGYLPSLISFDCNSENLSADFSGSPLLSKLTVVNASFINLKNGADNITMFDGFTKILCLDNNAERIHLRSINAKIFTGTTFDSTCPIIPIQKFNFYSGQINFNQNNAKCPLNNYEVPNFKLKIKNGANTFYQFTSQNGRYYYNTNLVDTNLIIEPILTNPYFVLNPFYYIYKPISLGLRYDDYFCLSPLGIHNDLSIIIYPITQARPGIISEYGIYCTNNGNSLQNFNIKLLFENKLMQFEFASLIPVIINQNEIEWTQLRLHPFESNLIKIKFKLNKPTDNPPLNNKDNLIFTAQIISSDIDNTPMDNISKLDQTVVNSLDPNYKLCLQNEKISLDKLSDYLNYTIHFENKGTASAVNIKIRDIIDPNKFDINTFTPLNASHNYYTQIINNNEVNFLFDNINLDFDSLNNAGFINYRIKPLSTLQTGDTIQNKAEIYFDYNLPIQTNTYYSIVQGNVKSKTIESPIFEFFPNPATTKLNISASCNLKSIDIFNLSGERVYSQKFYLECHTVDINTSKFINGIYHIKVVGETGYSINKLVIIK